MKKLLPMVMCSMFMISICAQNIQHEKIFVRIFDQGGIKIAKGKILSLTDEAIHLSKSKKPISISIQDIGYIKTKRSGGHNVLLGAGAGAGVGIIIGAASSTDSWFTYSASEGASGAGLAMGVFGAGIGGITALFKQQKNYPINGDPVQWQAFRESISGSEK